ncbi:hypothetical protein [Blastococcus jejuensis]|uniref:hypothetical protein n=1 Tax=Blastococcus jejuensis TaxID=351224 RepID=UPI0031CE77FC
MRTAVGTAVSATVGPAVSSAVGRALRAGHVVVVECHVISDPVVAPAAVLRSDRALSTDDDHAHPSRRTQAGTVR